RWDRKRRRLYVRHRIKANTLMIGLMLLGLAVRDTTTGWLMAGAPAGRGPIAGHLMVRPPEPDGAISGTVRFEPKAPGTARAATIASVLSRRQRPATVEATTSHSGRWSIPASALRRGWTYRITAQAGECPPSEAATITVPVFTRAHVPPLTAASCREARASTTDAAVGGSPSGTAR
ncbi:MAG: hypothetical protein OXG72_03135, partial [Acidobacteria bacterium]|nr:hypothetical protein [Acidobacteriota bacterium]